MSKNIFVLFKLFIITLIFSSCSSNSGTTNSTVNSTVNAKSLEKKNTIEKTEIKKNILHCECCNDEIHNNPWGWVQYNDRYGEAIKSNGVTFRVNYCSKKCAYKCQ